jgi:hypothetical protein
MDGIIKMDLSNSTPLVCFAYDQVDPSGVGLNVVAAKATFKFLGEDQLELAESQPFFQLTDNYYGPPSSSSLRRATEMYFMKVATDIYFVDPIARAPRGVPKSSWEVSVRIGTVGTRFTVTGKRRWYRTLLGRWKLTAPEMCTAVDVRFENAYGGAWYSAEELERFPENPVGVGFVDLRGLRQSDEIPAPQVFRPASPPIAPNQPCEVVGLTPIAPGWRPRCGFAGVLTAAWRDDRWSAYPPGFDPRFFNAAPVDLQYHGFLQGGEVVKLENLGFNGCRTFRLPLTPKLSFLSYFINGQRVKKNWKSTHSSSTLLLAS